MIRVISSPSSSTTGFFTLILAMRFPAILEFGGALDWGGNARNRGVVLAAAAQRGSLQHVRCEAIVW
jgi:hypothetical protein